MEARLYKPKYPFVGDIVVAQIVDIDTMGAKCKLLEYGDIDGFVPISEFSKRRIKSMRQIFQKGSIYPLQVINVEPSKGVIDLSKKHVTEKECDVCMKKYKEAKIADGILKRTAEICSVPKIVIYQQCIWPLSFKVETYAINDYNNEVKLEVEEKNGREVEGEIEGEIEGEVAAEEEDDNERPTISSLEVLHFLFREPSIIEMYALDSSIKSALINIVQMKLQPTSKKISAVVTLTCFGSGGINSIKDVLSKGLEFSKLARKEFVQSEDEDGGEPNKEYMLNVFTVGCPEYEMVIETKEIAKGVNFLFKVIEFMKNEMKSIVGGNLSVKRAPQVISD